MLILTADNKEKLEKALENARKESLIVSDPMPLSGVYIVTNPTHGTEYQVTIIKHAGKVEATCQCQGHQRGYICKHIAIAANEMKKDLTANKAVKSITFQGVGYHFPDMSNTELEELFDKVIDDGSWLADRYERGLTRLTPAKYQELSDASTAAWTAIGAELKTRVELARYESLAESRVA